MSERGIAGSIVAEAQGTHVAESHGEALWYAACEIHECVDVWQADITGLSAHEINEGWVCTEVIKPHRLTLLEGGLSSAEARRRLDVGAGGGLQGDISVVMKDTPSREG